MSHFFESWGPTLVAAGGVTVVAVAGAVLTELGPWYYGLKKPSWQPPDWLFGPAWTLIFILEATAGVLAWNRLHFSAPMVWLIALLAVNGFLNVFWSVLFFKWKRPDRALKEVGFLWLSIAAPMAVLFLNVGWAGALLLPYLAWVSFAAFLNWTIVRLNAPFGSVADVSV
jgi:tryptophan-rich sensory protein